MKLVSWNVNGLRACVGKGFLDFFTQVDADVFCLQETKLQAHQIELDLPGYRQYWCSAEKKGYSGTALLTKQEPLQISYELPDPAMGGEGRVITAEFERFFLVTCYTPNSQDGLRRLEHRLAWEDAFRAYLQDLDRRKPVVVCGDLNVAHQPIDLKNPSANRQNPGFTDAERDKLSQLLSAGFTDTFRFLNPDAVGAYTWWSYRFHARDNNAGWRIDYFLASDRLRAAINGAPIFSEITGSDHCPVGLWLDPSAI